MRKLSIREVLYLVHDHTVNGGRRCAFSLICKITNSILFCYSTLSGQPREVTELRTLSIDTSQSLDASARSREAEGKGIVPWWTSLQNISTGEKCLVAHSDDPQKDRDEQEPSFCLCTQSALYLYKPITLIQTHCFPSSLSHTMNFSL